MIPTPWKTAPAEKTHLPKGSTAAANFQLWWASQLNYRSRALDVLRAGSQVTKRSSIPKRTAGDE